MCIQQRFKPAIIDQVLMGFGVFRYQRAPPHIDPVRTLVAKARFIADVTFGLADELGDLIMTVFCDQRIGIWLGRT